MLLKLKCKKYGKGIGLLELMLSLAIIAILLIMATRYYSSASGSAKLQSAVEMVTAAKAAMNSYLGATVGTPAATPTIATLVQAGLLPQSFGGTSSAASTSNPWLQAIKIGTVTATTFQIILDTPTDSTCNAVAQQLIAQTTIFKSTNTALSASVSCGGGSTLTAQFVRGG